MRTRIANGTHRETMLSSRSRGLFALIAGLALASCSFQQSALRYSRPTVVNQPLDYREVAPSGPLASTFPEIYDTGPAIREKMLALIDSARDYILIDSFLVVTDPVTEEIMEALKRKHDEGVRVHVLADSSSRYMEIGEPGFDWLEEAGISNAEYNPIRVYKLLVAPVMLARDHRKFWIVDGKDLFLGGANIFKTSLEAPEDDGNLDYMVAVQSAEAIARMIESFVATWNHSSQETLRAGDFPVQQDHPVETQLWLCDQNKHVGNRDVVAQMFRGLFAVATEEVWLIQPYTFVTPEFLQHFRDLGERGVNVNVMLASDVHSPRFHYASYYGIKDMLEAGAKVWVYESGHGHLHAKATVVDGRWVSVGSANLNTRSYEFSKEANLVFGDPTSVERIMRVVEKLREHCRPVGMEEAEQYRTGEYHAIWLWMQLAG